MTCRYCGFPGVLDQARRVCVGCRDLPALDPHVTQQPPAPPVTRARVEEP